MALLAHISDLHFGAIDPAAQQALGKSIKAVEPDAVIVTGDLTQSGRKCEFEGAAQFLGAIASPLLVTPGNHDVPVYNLGLRFADPWRRFRRILGVETDAVLAMDGVKVIGLNSARRAGFHLDWSRGSLSRKQIDFAAEEIKSAAQSSVKIIALHHPVQPGPGVAGGNVVARAKKALAAFAGAGADLILTGHVHVAEASVHETASRAMVIARAGTATSTRVRGEAPSFNLIAAEDDALSIAVHRFDKDGYTPVSRRQFLRSDDGWRDPADDRTT